MRLSRLKFRQTTFFTVWCLSFLLSLGGARRIGAPGSVLTLFAVMVAVLVFRQKSVVSMVCVVLSAILLGLWRGNVYLKQVRVYEELFGKPVSFSGTVAADGIYGDSAQLSFEVAHVQLHDPMIQNLAGKIKVEGRGIAMVYKGDRVMVRGKLFPTRGSNQARSSYATFSLVSRSDSSIDALRRRFIAGLTSAVPEPQASFGAGLLIGQRSTLPDDVNDQLSVTGLTHLVAVSGYNLTIIIDVVRRLTGKRSKYQSFIFSIGLILLFVLMTGLSASIVRAAIVSSLSLVAWYYGRKLRPILLIGIAASITAYWNPFYIWSDIGWYLSFLAFFGVLIVSPVVVTYLSRKRSPKALGLLITETTCAQIMTLPIIMYIFGRLSVVGLLANILVAPLVPLAMICALVAGLAGMIIPMISGWLAWPATVVLTYMLDTTALLSRVPHAAVTQKISLVWLLVLYGVAILFVVLLGFKLRQQNVKITDSVRRF